MILEEQHIIIYEEINENNKKFLKNLEKYNHEKYGFITFIKDDKNVEYVMVRYCMKRNLCRLYNPINNIFNLEDTISVSIKILEGFFPADCIIWYCSEDVDWLLDIGFKNPYFCSYDPFYEKVDQCIAVNKINDPMFETNDRIRHKGNDTNPDIFQQRRTSPVREHRDNTIFDFTREHFLDSKEIEVNMR